MGRTMSSDLKDMQAFLQVARAGGFREAARATGGSAANLSDSVRRIEAQLAVRLLNRTTRSVRLTDAGRTLFDRIDPAFREIADAAEALGPYRDSPTGTLRLNVPVSAARLLPQLLPAFMGAYPDISVEIFTQESFVDVIAAGCDAGIRYGERLQKDMIAMPIGPRTQRSATAAATSYLERRGFPTHPRNLMEHNCIRGRFPSGAIAQWEFERDGELITVVPRGQLLVEIGDGIDLAVHSAAAGEGVVHLFEEWLQPMLASGQLVPVLQDWWQTFPGPFLYYPSRTLVPPPLRSFIDFVKARAC